MKIAPMYALSTRLGRRYGCLRGHRGDKRYRHDALRLGFPSPAGSEAIPRQPLGEGPFGSKMTAADDLEEYPSGDEEITGRCEGSSKMAVLRGGGDLRQGVEEMIGETRTILADGFDEEEVKILTYVRAEHPDLEGPFLANVHRGRGEILHRLVQALVRENVAGLSGPGPWRSRGEKGVGNHLSTGGTLP